MERRKALFDEEEKEEDEVPYITGEEKQDVVIPPKEEELKKSESKKGESSSADPSDKGFHDVGLGERSGGTTLMATLEDELNLDFMVGNPEDRSGHI